MIVLSIREIASDLDIFILQSDINSLTGAIRAMQIN